MKLWLKASIYKFHYHKSYLYSSKFIFHFSKKEKKKGERTQLHVKEGRAKRLKKENFSPEPDRIVIIIIIIIHTYIHTYIYIYIYNPLYVLDSAILLGLATLSLTDSHTHTDTHSISPSSSLSLAFWSNLVQFDLFGSFLCFFFLFVWRIWKGLGGENFYLCVCVCVCVCVS